MTVSLPKVNPPQKEDIPDVPHVLYEMPGRCRVQYTVPEGKLLPLKPGHTECIASSQHLLSLYSTPVQIHVSVVDGKKLVMRCFIAFGVTGIAGLNGPRLRAPPQSSRKKEGAIQA